MTEFLIGHQFDLILIFCLKIAQFCSIKRICIRNCNVITQNIIYINFIIIVLYVKPDSYHSEAMSSLAPHLLIFMKI
ncbi:hypothetical protein BpHYR1_001700 [Brachionus plicatilis]|uniref:Uncharacterized protein n=1 Tax=Brachionus plicatilis TaxID=10195 RepID=A0A3M7SZS6_BRAPC|nr:hypothetical protein BpHYR1_001700 [Brachionus plicatilis]